MKARTALSFWSIGGGLGIVYQPGIGQWRRRLVAIRRGEKESHAAKYADTLLPAAQPLRLAGADGAGRFISGNAASW